MPGTQPSPTCFLTIDCIQCPVSCYMFLNDFNQDEYETDGWTFGIFDQSNNGLIIESPRSAYIAGICPKHGDKA